MKKYIISELIDGSIEIHVSLGRIITVLTTGTVIGSEQLTPSEKLEVKCILIDYSDTVRQLYVKNMLNTIDL